MILICGMATYGAYKVNRDQATSSPPAFVPASPLCLGLSLWQQHAAWIIPFFCYQIFDFVLNTLVAISVVVYPNTVQDYLQQLVRTFCEQLPRCLTPSPTRDVLFLSVCLCLSPEPSLTKRTSCPPTTCAWCLQSSSSSDASSPSK